MPFLSDNNHMRYLFQFSYLQVSNLMLWEVKLPKEGNVINGRGWIWFQVFKIPEPVHHLSLHYLKGLHFAWSQALTTKVTASPAQWQARVAITLLPLPWASQSLVETHFFSFLSHSNSRDTPFLNKQTKIGTVSLTCYCFPLTKNV